MRKVLLAAPIMALALIAGPVPVKGEGLSLSRATTGSRLAMFRKQVAVLDSRAAVQYDNSVRLTPKAKVVTQVAIPSYSGAYRGLYLEPARAAARRHGVPEDLFLRLIQQESGWNPRAISPKGARGLAQLMPATARLLGVDINDPNQNLDGGARYLRMMYDRFGNWRLALAAYNAGPEAVERHDGIPPYRETRNYVRAILGS